MSYIGPFPLPITGGGTGQTTSPLFSAYQNAEVSNVTGDGTIYTVSFNTVLFDLTSSYNNGTFIFTAPVTAKYLFITTISFFGMGAGHTQGFGFFNVASNAWTFAQNNPNAIKGVILNETTYNGSMIFSLSANDQVKVQLEVDNSTKTIGLEGSAAPSKTTFSGFLIS